MIRRALFVALSCAMLSACSKDYSSPTNPTPTPTPPPTGTSVSIVTGAASLTSTAYSPNPITVAVGSTVKWTNTDSIAHTVTSDQAGVFNSGRMAPGDTFSMTFQNKGTTTYHCSFHPGMIASVVVQ